MNRVESSLAVSLLRPAYQTANRLSPKRFSLRIRKKSQGIPEVNVFVMIGYNTLPGQAFSASAWMGGVMKDRFAWADAVGDGGIERVRRGRHGTYTPDAAARLVAPALYKDSSGAVLYEKDLNDKQVVIGGSFTGYKPALRREYPKIYAKMIRSMVGMIRRPWPC